jgi:hypothetical protein
MALFSFELLNPDQGVEIYNIFLKNPRQSLQQFTFFYVFFIIFSYGKNTEMFTAKGC